jgi:GNAT superfamily N-acetyltransferase
MQVSFQKNLSMHIPGEIGFSFSAILRLDHKTPKICTNPKSSMPIRSIQPEADFPKVLELYESFEPEPLSLNAVLRWYWRVAPGRVIHVTIATDAQDQIVGYCEVFHEAWFPAGEFRVFVIVDPMQRKQGIGSALYAEAHTFLAEQGAVSLRSEVRDNCADELRFAEKRGFSIERCQFESTLDLVTFNESPFLLEVASLEAAGIRLASMADFGDSREARRKLYEVNNTTALDIPGVTEWMPFEDFEALICGAEWYRPEGQLVAVDGDDFVGLSAVKLMPQTQGAYNLMTGVLKAYRGRKIGLALKLAGFRYARQQGAVYIRTNNDSLNPAILALNRKLGYQPQAGKYKLESV